MITDRIGPIEVDVQNFSDPYNASVGSIVFVSQPRALMPALQSDASVIVLGESFRSEWPSIEPHLRGRTVLFSHEAERAMRVAIQHFVLKTPYVNVDDTEAIHPTAIVHSTAKLGARVRIGAFTVIARGVSIGDDAVIASHCVVECDSQIGSKTVVHPFVYIGHHCTIGNECEINPNTTVGKEGFGYAHDSKFNHFRIPHQGTVVIEDRVHLGSSNTIDRGTFGETRIGAGSILDNQIHIAHNAEIGANSVITAGFRVAGSTKIGRNFLTGGNTVVSGHIEICDNVNLSAVSGVSKSITTPGKYGGNPLLPLQDHIRMKVALTKLPELLKKLSRLNESRF